MVHAGNSLIHVFGPFQQEPSKKYPAVILLHGRGADEEDLLGLVPYLDSRFLTVAVRAPYRFPFAGHTWYDMLEDGTPDREQFQQSYDRLLDFVDYLKKEHPVDPNHIYLLGFSMGAVMSFALSLTHPETFRGVVAHSGYIPEHTDLSIRWTSLGKLGVCIAHGIHDSVVNVEHARRARHLLSATSARLTYAEFPIAHTISEASLRAIDRWLKGEIEDRSAS